MAASASLRDRYPAPALMGVVNVTPDSFSDGGRFLDPALAIEQGLKHAAEGAAIVDIGGESTRPGSDGISVDLELERVLPVIEGIRAVSDVAISIDTSKAVVAEAALRAGASMVNDVTALSDPAMAALVAESEADLCVMHMLGTPRTMQVDPHYDDVVREVADWLCDRVERACDGGVARDRICVDPGIGFGKNMGHNLSLIAHVDVIGARCGAPVLIGLSRKSFLGRIMGDMERDRTIPTIAANVEAARRGAFMLRVHDVGVHRDAFAAVAAIGGAR
ncbi:MAG: dihydropteroate synthase [Gaiellaceae bacterium]|nr:dihydropteroate synthase [Gaiellaceae bacterium]